MQEGTQVDGYRIVRKLGQGAMGAVYEAVHEDGRRAAVKVLLSQFTGDAEIVTRFFNEARAAALIDHPGVVRIFGTGKTPDGSSYIAMEFLEGESLKDRLKGSGGRLRVNMFEIAGQIASALCAAHERKIIHRDLKPDNIMIVPDPSAPGGERVKILDFGIAKLLDMDDVGVQTAAGVAMGTPTYMSPEQFTGAGEVTARADVYSLGVILYHFIAGRPPFLAKGPGELLQQHARGIVLPLKQLEPGVNDALAALVHRMLAKTADERPTMQEVRDELQAIASGGRVVRGGTAPLPLAQPPAAPAAPASPAAAEPAEGTMFVRPAASPRSRRTLLLGAALIVLVVVLGAVGALALRRSAPPAQQTKAPAAAPAPAPVAPDPDRAAGDQAPPKEAAPEPAAPSIKEEPPAPVPARHRRRHRRG